MFGLVAGENLSQRRLYNGVSSLFKVNKCIQYNVECACIYILYYFKISLEIFILRLSLIANVITSRVSIYRKLVSL